MTEPALTPESLQDRFGLQLSSGEVPLKLYTRHWIVLLRWGGLILLLLSPPAGLLAWSIHGSGQQLTWWIILLTLLYLAAIALLGYYGYADWRNDALIMTDQRLLYVEQTILLSYTMREALLSNVQNVRSSSKGLLASLLRYGDLVIETAARRMDISFGPIPHPQKAQQDIMARLEQIRAQISRQRIEETLRRHLYGEQPEEGPAQEEPPPRRRWFLIPPNPLIEGENITWHKHWFFLLRRQVGPVLLLALSVAGFFLLPALPFAVPGWVYIVPAVLLPLSLATIVWRYQVWKGDVYTLTATQLHDIYRTPWGLLGEERRIGELSRIQNISFQKPGLLAWVLDFGDVRIQTAGAEDFTFSRVPHPEEVQREIYRRQAQARQREEERERERIAEYLAVYRKLERERSQE
ncbi:MAG: PH domain-containing protein [Chloroflexia bacterium]